MPDGNPQAYLNPMTRGGAGPSPRDLPDDILGLLELLARSGAGPAAEAIARNRSEPNEDLLRALLMRAGGGRPSDRQVGAAAADVGRRQNEVPPPPPASNLADSKGLLEWLLGNS